MERCRGRWGELKHRRLRWRLQPARGWVARAAPSGGGVGGCKLGEGGVSLAAPALADCWLILRGSRPAGVHPPEGRAGSSVPHSCMHPPFRSARSARRAVAAAAPARR